MSRIGLFILVFAAALLPRFAPATTPGDSPTLEQAAAYLEGAQQSLDAFRRALRAGQAKEQEDAMGSYKQSLSRFHITIGRTKVRKQDLPQIQRLVDSLERQVTVFEALADDAKADHSRGVNDALSHLRGALEITRAKLARRSILKLGGAASERSRQ